MKPFRLDENFNNKRFAAECCAEKAATVNRFPSKYKGVPDEIWMPIILASNETLVTKDFRIIEENKHAIPNPNNGAIVVRPQNPKPGFGVKEAKLIVSNFKSNFPAWAKTSWDDVYVEITEVEIRVGPLRKELVGDLTHLSFASKNFENELNEIIAAARKTARKIEPERPKKLK